MSDVSEVPELEAADALSKEELDAVREGYADVLAGRTRPAAEFLDEIRSKYGF